MSAIITVAPSPHRLNPLLAGEAIYLIELATLIADEEPDVRVFARYGLGNADVMEIRSSHLEDDVLF
ncbi:hypothetical protein [Phaeospirillum tilakii]|uniref:Uncharacterized protein n=1 Tax=Phaeospirillum tilakii TaxID=741673 RepID=A0ABW5CAY9_9PROT